MRTVEEPYGVAFAGQEAFEAALEQSLGQRAKFSCPGGDGCVSLQRSGARPGVRGPAWAG
jgi:hypothetical protein